MGSANIIINCPALAFLDSPADATSNGSDVPTGVNAGTGGQAAGTGGQADDGTDSPLLPLVLIVTGAGVVAAASRRLVRR